MRHARRGVLRRLSFLVWSLPLIPATGHKADSGGKTDGRALSRLQSSDGSVAPGPSPSERRLLARQKRQFTARPDWWPWPDGAGLAAYGHVAASEVGSPHTLILPNQEEA